MLHQQLSARPISIYSKKTLHDISKLFINKQCSSISSNQFKAILEATNNNTITQRSTANQAFLLTLKARISSIENYQQADDYYRQAYQTSRKPGLLDEHTAMLIKYNQIELAKKVAEQLINDFQPMTATQRRDHQQLLQWLKEQQTKVDTP